jgi:hypothetical protein
MSGKKNDYLGQIKRLKGLLKWTKGKCMKNHDLMIDYIIS